jgi:hypothetical protein
MQDGCGFNMLRGVFSSKSAAEEFKKYQQSIERFDDFSVERWRVETIADVRAKITMPKRGAM